VGSLGHILLNWNDSTGGNLTGYNIYKSTDGINFTVPPDSPIAAPTDSYDDTAVADGVVYWYKVTAVGDAESGFSNTVKDIHGTRLNVSYPAGCTLGASGGPYVAEGTVTLENNLIVNGGGALYVKDGAIIDIKAGYRLLVSAGLLRVVAGPGADHATFTSHDMNATLDGFSLHLTNAVNYNPLDGSGTLIQNTLIENLRNSTQAIWVTGCSPRFYNVKVYDVAPTGLGRLFIESGAAPIIENCFFSKMTPAVNGDDMRSIAFSMKYNVFTGQYYCISFYSLDNPGIDAGQIELNEFDGSRPVYLFDMTGSYDVPLGNNYWNGGTGTPPVPGVVPDGTTPITVTCDFDTALASPPAGAGPTW
jgi:hypothetical protein